MNELKYELETKLDEHMKAMAEILNQIGIKSIKRYIGNGCYVGVTVTQLDMIDHQELKI